MHDVSVEPEFETHEQPPKARGPHHRVFVVVAIFALLIGISVVGAYFWRSDEVSHHVDSQVQHLCESTGGTYQPCPPCPRGAVCSPCPKPCRCSDGAVWNAEQGCVLDHFSQLAQLCESTGGTHNHPCPLCAPEERCVPCVFSCECAAGYTWTQSKGCLLDAVAEEVVLCESTGGVHVECSCPDGALCECVEYCECPEGYYFGRDGCTVGVEFSYYREEGWGPCIVEGQCHRTTRIDADGEMTVTGGNDLQGSVQLSTTSFQELIETIRATEILTRRCESIQVLDYWSRTTMQLDTRSRTIQFPECEEEMDAIETILAPYHTAIELLSSNDPSAAPRKIMTYRQEGGLCISGDLCWGEWDLFTDGSYVQRAHEYELFGEAGAIPPNDVAKLIQEVAIVDFDEIKSRPFEGTCPIAYDGSMNTYTFVTDNGEEIIGSCTYDLEPFESLTDAIWDVHAEILRQEPPE